MANRGLYKKAEGLSLQAVAIAAIILVVLVMILAIFKGGIDRIVPPIRSVNECKTPCVTASECVGGEPIKGLGCPKEKDGADKDKVYCCIKKDG